MTILLGLCFTLLFASVANAEEGAEGIASLVEVRGNVLISRNSSLASANEAARLFAGTRVLTTANSAAVVQYDEGCRVELKENQRFEIDAGRHCTAQSSRSQAESPRPSAVPTRTVRPRG